MENLEIIIKNLCGKAESNILTIDKVKNRQKWFRINGKIMIKEIPQIESAIELAFYKDSFVKSEEYQAMEQLLNRDSIFSKAAVRGGYYGLPKNLISRILLKSIVLENGNIALDFRLAITELIFIKKCFQSDEVLYKARARILGVELNIPRIKITDNIYLVKLTDDELNERQEYIDLSDFEDSRSKLLNEFTEIRMTMKIPIDENIDTPVLSTGNEASIISTKVFRDMISAIRLTKSGNIELGITHISSFNSSFAKSTIYKLYTSPSNILIDNSDVELLLRSYNIVTLVQNDDKILERVLNRFLLGKQRHNPIDRLVDYVIAWESILLTVSGGSIMNEISYRFGINGSSILYACGEEKDRSSGLNLMKKIYSIRSKIVHGGSEKEINDEILKAKFSNSSELVIDIEKKMRSVIFWLSDLKIEDRPYFKQGGWEELIWSS